MFIVFDTETSDLPKKYSVPITDTDNWPRIVELAWKTYDKNGVNLETHDYIIKPNSEFVITDDSIKIHRITNEKAQEEGVELSVALDAFEQAFKNAEYLVAHNISFDEKVVGCELFRHNRRNFIYDLIHIDTMKSTIDFVCAPAKRGGGYKYPTLAELYFKLFSEYFQDAHNALVDVTALAKCFFELQRIGIYSYGNDDRTKLSSDIFINMKQGHQRDASELSPIANLSLHTFHSILDGAGSVKEYVKLAKKYNQKYLGITDVSTLSGSFDFYNTCRKNDIKPIIGIELYVNDKIGIIDNGKAQGDSYKIRAFAKNDKGFKNLSKILYKANTEGFFNIGRASSKWLYENSEGIIVTISSLESKVAQFLQKGKSIEAEKYVLELIEAFGRENVYAEIQFNSHAQQKSYNNFVINIASQHNLNIILTNNIFFPNKEDFELQNIVTSIKQKSPLEGARLKDNLELYFYSSDDYYYFNKKNGYNYPDNFIEHCFKNTIKLADACNFDFEIGVEKYPRYEPTKDVTDYFKTDNVEEIIYRLAFMKLKQKLKVSAQNGLLELTDEVSKKYHDQLQYELDIIRDKKMLDYFMVNWEMIRDYRSKGYDIGPARGCFVPGSPVVMSDGVEKAIESIVVGEQVIDAHGVTQDVVDVLEYDVEEELLSLEFEDGRVIECTKDHEFLTVNRGWVQAQHLTEFDEIEEVGL